VKKIAVIFHEHERKRNIRRFAIWHVARFWIKENIEPVFLFGTGKFVPAELALLHVDLTVVPEKYLEFSRLYPVVLNGEITDIRKSRFSKQKVRPGDGYEGPVIVKSELNYAGQPERKLSGHSLSRLAFRIKCRFPSFRPEGLGMGPAFASPQGYRIYHHANSVPADWFRRDDILVERFIPEIHRGLYGLRVYHFLGNRGVCMLRKARHPIVNTSTVVSREQVDVHPEIAALAKTLKFDFGKFDYVVHEGQPVLLDANKTPGGSASARFIQMCSEWAKGIHCYL